jgi:intracellular multiplication protein IcmP
MIAVFALHACCRRREAAGLLGVLSESLQDANGETQEGPDKPLSFSAAAVRKADQSLTGKELGVIHEIMSRHYYTATGMMSLLCHARQQAGILTPGQFAFLKLADRRLWYALHSLGFEFEERSFYAHPSPRIEAIGARDHWAAEKIAGGALAVPVLDQAVAAILKARTEKPSPARSLLEDQSNTAGHGKAAAVTGQAAAAGKEAAGKAVITQQPKPRHGASPNPF